jgi:hypothetical protein
MTGVPAGGTGMRLGRSSNAVIGAGGRMCLPVIHPLHPGMAGGACAARRGHRTVVHSCRCPGRTMVVMRRAGSSVRHGVHVVASRCGCDRRCIYRNGLHRLAGFVTGRAGATGEQECRDEGYPAVGVHIDP